jgi:hypothetical protein
MTMAATVTTIAEGTQSEDPLRAREVELRVEPAAFR